MVHLPLFHVSICLTTYNRAEVLPKTLDGLLAQAYGDFELIISGVCSSDQTEEECREYARKDPGVKYYLNEANLKRPGNLNADNLKQAVLLQCSLEQYFFSTSSRTCAAKGGSLSGVVAMCCIAFAFPVAVRLVFQARPLLYMSLPCAA